MQSQDVAQRPAPPSPAGPVVDVEQAEAALVEHYPRLVRLAYLVLPPGLGRSRRVLTAHALTQRGYAAGRPTPSLSLPGKGFGLTSQPITAPIASPTAMKMMDPTSMTVTPRNRM